jgi:hypothetical protein
MPVAEKRPGGRRALRQSPGRPRPSAVRLVGLVGGALLTAAAWLHLVAAAIEFGVLAVHGESRAWLFTFGASVGAVVCLMLMLALAGRGLRSLGLFSDYRPRRAAPRRRR